VVADHSENLGIYDYIERGDPILKASENSRKWLEYFQAGEGIKAAYEWSAFNAEGKDPIDSAEMQVNVWERVIANAEKYNEPGVFTAFIGYEWTSGPGSNNLHRNVILRDGGDRAKQWCLSRLSTAMIRRTSGPIWTPTRKIPEGELLRFPTTAICQTG
jgi:hypothetical protein